MRFFSLKLSFVISRFMILIVLYRTKFYYALCISFDIGIVYVVRYNCKFITCKVILSLGRINEKTAVDVLGQVKEVLDRYRLQYWLDSGTLLGAISDRKFIEWDNDIDLGSFETELKKLSLACNDLQKKGFY